jgi:hypothetical protein
MQVFQTLPKPNELVFESCVHSQKTVFRISQNITATVRGNGLESTDGTSCNKSKNSLQARQTAQEKKKVWRERRAKFPVANPKSKQKEEFLKVRDFVDDGTHTNNKNKKQQLKKTFRATHTKFRSCFCIFFAFGLCLKSRQCEWRQRRRQRQQEVGLRW